MHTRKEIINNQNQFRAEIVDWIKKDFSKMKKEIYSIKSNDEVIKIEKEKLLKKAGKIKISKELENLFISEKNIYPKFYAWWDEETQEVIKHKYIDK